MRRILAIALTMLVLGGCVQTITPQQTSQIKSLAIITGFGEQIELNFVGFTVFTNRANKANVDWQIDRHFKQRTQAELGSRFQFREIAYNPATIRQEPMSIFGADPAIALVRSVARPGVADAILYYGPARFDDTLGGSNQSVEGLGLYARSAFGFGTRTTVAFTAWRAVLFDGSTLQPIGEARALFPTQMSFPMMTFRSRIPHVDSPIPVRERYEDMSGGERSMAQDMIFNLVGRTMPEVLTDLKLR